ncbi:hypothetical protein [Vibrio chagasii]|uniref:hypothetical protein n=1 Tax=Vibrio chagasii TaxID=170679 RepID=UPI0037350ADF
MTEEEFEFFAEIDDLIGGTKVERLSRGGFVEPVSANHNGKELPDVTELKDKTLEAIVMLDRPPKRLDALDELSNWIKT